MNPELQNQLIEHYNQFLQTERGQKAIQVSKLLQYEWNSSYKTSDVVASTNNVNINKINKRLQSKIKKIDIIPIGLNNQCHLNSIVFNELPNVKKVLGFNVTACPCGRRMSYELHSVNKIGEILYDFTTDFNEEKSKYFLELGNINIYKYIQKYGREAIQVDKCCNCRIDWSITETQDEYYLEQHILDIQNNT